ncbi:VOC family protein [Paramicrobacterium agarici]|uniref:Catechol 2,3-dioxygenase-like lactoylglutathione lyase family enzyme n=1 Tax=Paramicrobacterium agarici TaxID=630514 RepID=A0A2A9DTM6_9MICO|nr:VOC family protein [Microbacterium agarici]PFG30048.1 catechol 2,3-dioxygenase-like lactoylglutathione lyase family enzyme [Microbacterium agarici]
MSTPGIRSIHHVTLSVSDIDASVAWYRDVLGFDVIKQLRHNGLEKALLHIGDVLVTFVGHGDAAEPGEFSERRVGLDHLSFGVDADAIEAWAEHLESHGVTWSPIVDGLSGRVLSFRDPDNIALEFYTIE